MSVLKGLVRSVLMVALFFLLAEGSEFSASKSYEYECAGCHGDNHEGGLGSDLRAEAIGAIDDAILEEIILHGVEGGIMPSFSNLFTPKEAHELVRYLKNYPSKK